MSKLFITQKQEPMTKKASSQLSPDVSNWPFEIVDQVYMEWPQLRGNDLTVDIIKYDKKTESALGRIIIKQAQSKVTRNNNTNPGGQQMVDAQSLGNQQQPMTQQQPVNKQASQEISPDQISTFIPIVVKNRELKDLDLIVHGGKLMPLPSQGISKFFSVNIIDEITRYPSINEQPWQPSNSFYNSANVSPSSPGTYNNTKLASDGGFLEKLATITDDSLKKEFILKVAKDPSLEPLLHKPSIRKFLTTPKETHETFDSVYSKKASDGKYDVASVRLQPFKLYRTRKENIKEASYMTSNEAKVINSKQTVPTGDKYGFYTSEHGGKNKNVLFIPMVTDFHNIYNDKGIAIHNDGYFYTDKIAGDFKQAPGIKRYEPDGFGVFIFNTDKTAVASYPMTINKGIDGKVMAKTADANYELVYNNSLKKPLIKNNTLFIPIEWNFVPLNNKLSEFIETKEAKLASSINNGVAIYKDESDGTYMLSGKQVNDIAKKHFDHHSTVAILMALGVNTNTAEELLKSASYLDPVYITTNRVVSLNEPSQFIKLASDLKTDLIKEAAILNDETDIDTIFALNFITPENLEGFYNMSPIIDETLTKLAGLLMATRVGVKQLPELSIKTAIRGLQGVNDSLKLMRFKI
jgi:hypothetical protein